MQNLPHEILVEILSRLPVKSLCRFKCVSKPWLLLISDPHFIKLHMNQTKKPRLIVSCQSIYSVDLEQFDDSNGALQAIELDRLPKSYSLDNLAQLVGCCNGLICIRTMSVFFSIYNPCTGESKDIINSLFTRSASDPDLWFADMYGFGYAPSIDDYKLIKVTLAGIDVYSLRTNSWKKSVQHFPYTFPTSANATLLNGAIHWVLSPRDNSKFEYVIAAFNLTEETWKELPLPDGVITEFHCFRLGVLNGCIWLMYNGGAYTTCKEFWVMKEYGVEESWIKIEMTVSYTTLVPLCLVKNGKALLVIDRNHLILCNLENGICEDVLVGGMPDVYRADIYVESLVSPNLGNWV